jgi:carboxymethylenebutenolidase
MCDDHIAVEVDEALARRGVSRREFAAISAAAMTAISVSAGAAAQAMGGLTEAMVNIPTPDGTMDAFFVHPAEGKHPAIVMWPDIAGLRDAFKTMARALAAKGYSVVCVNHYYRNAKAPVMKTISEFFTPAGRTKLQPMIQAITNPGIVSDSKAILAWLDKQAAVDTAKKAGAEGYCMTGGYAVRTAAAVPDRVGVACSFHGAGVVTDAPDSPDKLIKDSNPDCYFLFAIAQNDDARSPNDKFVLRKVAEETGRGIRAEVFYANHGWCVPDTPVYDREEATRARNISLAFYDKLSPAPAGRMGRG